MNSTVTPTIHNCSISNPCGRNGYCKLEDGKVVCDCKFWWNGDRCDELTNNGKQVIVLGALTGALIVAFYIRILLRWIGKRQKSRNHDSYKTMVSTDHSVSFRISAKSSRERIYFWITSLGTFILGVTALLIKWAILRPVHRDMVNRFNESRFLGVQRPLFCETMHFNTEFKLFTFPFAVALTFIFFILTKRQSIRSHRPWHRFVGVAIPLDFFGHVKRTFSIVIFAVYAEELLEIAYQLLSGEASESYRGILMAYLFQLFKVMLIGFRCYPTLVAVYMNTIFSLICGALYTWLDFGTTIFYGSLCLNTYYPLYSAIRSDPDKELRLERFFKYYGTGPTLIIFQLIMDMPRYFCLAYISIQLPVLLFQRIFQSNATPQRRTREQELLLQASLPDSTESCYIRTLLGYQSATRPKYRFIRWLRKLCGWHDGFRFSARILCIYATIFLVLFIANMQTIIQVIPKLEELRSEFEGLIYTGLAMVNLVLGLVTGSKDEEFIRVRVPNLVRPFLIGMIGSSLITILQLVFMLTSVRRNLLQVFRGDDSEIPRRTSSKNTAYAVGNFHFGGYLIGYLTWGYVLVLVLTTVLAILIDLWITYGNFRIIEIILKLSLPVILLVVFKLFLNKCVAQYLFLQNHGDYLAIENRRLFMVFIYFDFFLAAFLGLFASLMRILKSILAGIIYMCRLDYSLLGRKLETLDDGFMAYCGFIHMECAHRHPILVSFASHLLRQYLQGKEGGTKLSRAQRRWHLAAFLIINPAFVYQRKAFLKQFRIHNPTDVFHIEQYSSRNRRGSTMSGIELNEIRQQYRF